MTRRGFTMLEMSLAMVIGSMLVITCFGLMRMIEDSEQYLARSFDDVSDFSRCHRTIGRAMQSLVAAPIQLDDGPTGDADDALSGARADFRERGGNSTSRRGSSENGPPRFRMGPIDEEDLENFEAPWRIELVLTKAPFQYAVETDRPVRGAFDKIADGRDWTLQWTPIDPPGDPVVLAEGLAQVWFSAIQGTGPEAVLEARQSNEFPRAVRVVIFARSGAAVDWLFEPGITTGDFN